MIRSIIALLLVAVLCFPGSAQPGMDRVDGGEYVPLYGNDSLPVTVAPFLMDIVPVTNRQFEEFVTAHKNWQKSSVPALFADDNYLRYWQSDTLAGHHAPPHAPVTNVSWFAAREYCRTQGKRLPTMDEWEFAALADSARPDAREDTAFLEMILEWYEKPTPEIIPEVASGRPNYWGIHDLHGLVWEWVSDFNSLLLSGASRQDKGLDRNLFCAGSAVGSTDPTNYAAYMRYAFRSSLKARYSVKNLGFRCARNIESP